MLLYDQLRMAELTAPAEMKAAKRVDATGFPPQTALKKSQEGWQLWQKKEYAGRTYDGFYTDPDKSTMDKDFWSDGTYARVDDTSDGMFETVFVVREEELIYIGSLESPFIFKNITKGQEETVKEYLAGLREKSRR